MPDYGAGKRSRKPRGTYGNNEGDIYLMGDAMQEMMREDNPNLVGIIEMFRNEKTGKVEEHYYTTEDPEIIERAKKGNKLFLAGSLYNIDD